MDADKQTAKDIKKFDVTSLPNSSFSIVLAKRRGGKSTLIGDIITKMQKKGKLDCCLLFSGTDADFTMVDQPYRYSDISKLHQVLDRYKAMTQYNAIADPASRFKIRTLIVLDDLLLKLKSKDFKVLEELAVNGRHCAKNGMCLHIVVLAQNLTSIPRIVRNNADMIFLNNISSMREREILFDEFLYLLCSSREGKKDSRQLYDDLINQRDFTFMVIENYKQNARCFSDYIKYYIADKP